MFRIVVPHNDGYSFDYETSSRNDIKTGVKLTKTEQKILELIKENPVIMQKELADILELSNSGIRYAMKGLKEKELLIRTKSRRNGGWKLEITEDENF